jgi:hypothetical protein
LFSRAQNQVAARLTGLLTGEVAELFLSHVPETAEFEADLQALKDAGIDPAELDDARETADSGVLMGYIALKWLAPSPAESSATEVAADTTLPSRLPLPEFFKKSPNEVARTIAGKTLLFGDKTLTIGKAQGQDPAQNAAWLKKPIFGDDPANAMVVKYRGHKMLFIRTGDTNSCVRILSGLGQGGEKLLNTKQICEYLGLEVNTYGVGVEDIRISLVADPVESA